MMFVFGVSTRLTDERARAPNTNNNSSSNPVDDRAVGPRARSEIREVWLRLVHLLVEAIQHEYDPCMLQLMGL